MSEQIAKVSYTVSVIIAAYNSGTTIARAIRSALAEPETIEVIIVDDASLDDTILRARETDDGTGRVKILQLAINSGPSTARNKAILESQGEWISILDADDYFLPGRFKGMADFIDNSDLIADDIYRREEKQSEETLRLFLGNLLPHPRSIFFQDFVLSNITDRNRHRGELGFIKPLIRRSFLEQHKISYKENMRLGEDYELYARALALGARMILVPAKGYVSVLGNASLSVNHSEEDLRHLRDCDINLITLPKLTTYEKKLLRKHYLDVDCRLQWRLLILAIKQRNIRKILSTFCRPYPVPLYLLRRLFDQLVIRSGFSSSFKSLDNQWKRI